MDIADEPVSQTVPGFMTEIPSSTYSPVPTPSPPSNSIHEFVVNFDDEEGLLVEQNFTIESEIKVEEPWY